MEFDMKMNVIVAVFLCLISQGVCLPNGAPISACSSLLPRHPGTRTQEGSSPYKVSAVKTRDNKVAVTISAPHSEEFRGFIMQARSTSDRKKLVAGEFEGENQLSKAIDCNAQKKSTLTHSSDNPKREVTAEWTSSVDEDIIFHATVLKDYSHFWENVDSDPVKMKNGELTSSEMPTKHSMYDACLKTNRCLGLPLKCVGSSSCDVLLSHNTPDGTIQFSLQGSLKPSEYMAMAFSDDALMGDDFVTECIRTGTNDGKLQHSWNVGKRNTEAMDASVKYEFIIEDGIASCTWEVENITIFNGRLLDLLNKKYHVLLAQGTVESGRIKYHSKRQAFSDPIHFFPNSKPTVIIQTDDDSTDNRSGAKKPAFNETDIESSCSQITISLLLFGLSLLTLQIG